MKKTTNYVYPHLGDGIGSTHHAKLSLHKPVLPRVLVWLPVIWQNNQLLKWIRMFERDFFGVLTENEASKGTEGTYAIETRLVAEIFVHLLAEELTTMCGKQAILMHRAVLTER